jgi:uncharacterized membrane protein
MAIDIGQGTYVTFGSALATATGYKITGVNHGGITRAVADATHMQSVAKEFVGSSIYDPGELSVEVLFDPAIKPTSDLTNVATNQTVNVYWAAGGTATQLWSAYGFATGFEAGAQMEDMMSGTLTIKLSGTLPS